MPPFARIPEDEGLHTKITTLRIAPSDVWWGGGTRGGWLERKTTEDLNQAAFCEAVAIVDVASNSVLSTKYRVNMELNQLNQFLMLLVEQCRRARLAASSRERGEDPQPGDPVVEITKFGTDPDAIGWLVAHGDAPYEEDGSGPGREIWDIVPLSGARGRKTPYQRWENAQFVKVATRLAVTTPAEVLALIRKDGEE